MPIFYLEKKGNLHSLMYVMSSSHEAFEPVFSLPKLPVYLSPTISPCWNPTHTWSCHSRLWSLPRCTQGELISHPFTQYVYFTPVYIRQGGGHWAVTSQTSQSGGDFSVISLLLIRVCVHIRLESSGTRNSELLVIVATMPLTTALCTYDAQ